MPAGAAGAEDACLPHGDSIDRGHPMADSGEDLELWNAAAAGFQEIDSDPTDWRREKVLRPTVLSLLGELAALDVLDAGCGPGWLSLQLARRGARVTAIDGARKMVNLARRRAATESAQVTVLRADLCRGLPFRSDAFDVVVCHMVLMDLPDIRTPLSEFSRLLRPSGRMVIAITHPAFFPQFWEKDATGRPLWKRVDDYLTVRSEIIDMCGGPTRHYHRPLTYYFAELHSAGFVVDKLVEPVPAGQRTPELDHAWRVPDFVVMRALPRERAAQRSS
jgi:SAM-dependent methyltransferase